MDAPYEVTANQSTDGVTEIVMTAWNGSGNESLTRMPIVSSNMPTIRFISEVVLSLPLAIFGILGNMLAFIVLCRQKKRLTTNVLLQTLAVADTLVLISSILLRSMRFVHWRAYDDVFHYVFLALYPCVYFFRLADIWITVLMTVDRYIAVCHPLKAQSLCTLRRTYITIAIILVATFTFSLPRLFEFKLTDRNFATTGYISTPLVRSRSYTIIYRITMFFVGMYLIPTTLLTGFNVRLLHTLRRAYRQRDEMLSNGSSHCKGDDSRRPTPSGVGITLIVVTLVIVCVICNVMTMVTHIIWTLEFCFVKLGHLEKQRRLLANFSNILVTFNSAINFLIYCVFSRKFRSGVRETFRCCRLSRRRPDYRSCTSTATNTSLASMIRYPDRISFKGQKLLPKQKSNTEL
ncbi:hypothetical protein LSH36_1411g00000 [Paralvinella palmiformis]|uniref:G-protein coupled receptors family 1 profile domain-containing protein n=1 Tax=Paralvinella palmiformis TaxID=53620 RepID=A0AAD9MRE8_9ANNE|nr:hypothetical protein LSH36_1411g00000 [Paralvinella palmiformis]